MERPFDPQDADSKRGFDMEQEDYADPARKEKIDRVNKVRNAVYANWRDGDLLSDYQAFVKTLPEDARLTHYLRSSSPAGDVQRFDDEADSIVGKVERFAEEHRLLH